MNYAPPVTAHAVLRYLTRVEGFDLKPVVRKVGRAAGSWAVAIAACDQLGVRLIEIQKRICPEHLAAVVKAGAARVRRDGMVLVCKGGMVVSVMDEERRGQVKVLSRREIKRGAQRLSRRRR